MNKITTVLIIYSNEQDNNRLISNGGLDRVILNNTKDER